MAAMLDFTTKERLSLLLKERKTENWQLIWLSQRTKKRFLFFFNLDKLPEANASERVFKQMINTRQSLRCAAACRDTHTHTRSWWWSDREEDLQVCNSLTHTHTHTRPRTWHTLPIYVPRRHLCSLDSADRPGLSRGHEDTFPARRLDDCVCVFCYQTCETALSINTHKHVLVFVSLWGHRCDVAASYLL